MTAPAPFDSGRPTKRPLPAPVPLMFVFDADAQNLHPDQPLDDKVGDTVAAYSRLGRGVTVVHTEGRATVFIHP